MALGHITVNLLETLNSQNSQQKSVDIKDFNKLNLFGLTRLIDTIIINAFRVNYCWKYVESLLNTLAISKFTQFRNIAIEATTCLIINIFDYMKQNPGSKVPEDSNQQAMLLGSLLELCENGSVECIKGVAVNLQIIIEVSRVMMLNF